MGIDLHPRAAALLGRSHGVAGRLLGSVNGSQFVLPLPLLPGGSVAVDGKSAARRQLTCSVTADLDDPRVDPFNAEVRAEYGITDPSSGITYWTPAGVFVVTEAQEERTGVVALKGVDRWQRVADARFERPRVTSGDTVAAITALLTEADSRITVVADTGLTGTHRASVWDRDRGDAILKLAKSIGARVFFDATGVARIARLPSFGDAVFWQVGSGQGGAKSSARRGVTRDRTYSAVVVVGEPGGNTPPVYGVARDTAAGSRTLYGGPFGKKPRYYRTSLVTTEAQANNAAAALLPGVLGVARTLTLEGPPHPGLDADDVINAEVQRGYWQRHLAESFTLPLGLGTLAVATRTNASEDDDGE